MTIFESLNLPADYEYILTKQGIVSEVDQLSALEQYQLVTRNEIVAFLNESFLLVQFDSVTSIDRNSDFAFFEAKYNILIQVQDRSSQKLTIYSAFGQQLSKEAIDIELNDYQLQYVTLTPYNFKQLAQEEIQWDLVLLYKVLILYCIANKITDLHFDVLHTGSGTQCVARGRYGNQLVRLLQFQFQPSDVKAMVAQLLQFYTQVNTEDLELPEGVDASIETKPEFFQETEAILRLKALPVLDGYTFVTRIQTATTAILPIDRLGFSKQQTKDLHRIATQETGLVLIGGAMRTGKNTTAFALLHEKIETSSVKICSYEHPIEYLLPITQIDYKGSTDTLQRMIAESKRLDIDLAYVNEIPSAGVAHGVQELVNSSVGVITTLHVNRLWHVPYKLYEFFGSEYKNVISQISGIFVQKMFEFLCPHCRAQQLVEEIPDSYSDVREFLIEHGVTKVYSSVGCSKCNSLLANQKGFVPGFARPRMEHLVFDAGLRSKLLECETPFQMERLLKDVVLEKKQSFEFTLLEEIQSGVLHYSIIRSIL